MTKNRFGILALCAALAGGCASHRATGPHLVSVRKIWDAAPHCAFTDLIRFHDQWFCTFREAQSHMADHGKIRVLVSANGGHWKSAALLAENGVDLRDPKLSVTPDGHLMLSLGGTIHTGRKAILRHSRVAFSTDGFSWTTPQPVLNDNDWLWRVTWHDGHAYGVAYNTGSGGSARLVESDDGIHYETVAEFKIPGMPNEATVRFLDDGKALALIRRDRMDKSAWIGSSSPPYHDWAWKPAGRFIGGPNFIVLPDARVVASGREFTGDPPKPKTFIGWMNGESISPMLVLPSGGDCSYPGLAWKDGLLWITYYSSHEGRTSIYLAKVKL